MNTNLKYYKRFRSLGYTAERAYHAAATLQTFRELEDQGLVTIEAIPEEESYFSIYGEPETEREREAIIEAIERNGCYYVRSVGVNICECCGKEERESIDGVGMCIYSDPCDPFVNDYVIDLMSAAIKSLNQSAA
jgi:hypothetical protein